MPARPALFALLPWLLLGGCGLKTNEFPPLCPNPTFLRDLSDIVRYRPGSAARDDADLILRGRLTSVRGKCEEDSPTRLETVVEVSMDLMRGPAMVGRKVRVPIFVAITDNGEIVNKQIFPVDFEFPENVDTATVGTPRIALTMPVSVKKSGAAYGLIVGFQLAPEELAINRRKGS